MKHYSDVERNDAATVSQAIQLIKQNQIDEARLRLQEVVKHTPEDYIYSFEESEQLLIKFWDHDEFVHYCMALEDKQEEQNVIWLASAYPQAYYYLAYLDMQEGHYESAYSYLKASLELEPDQPLTYCGVALIYNHLGQHEQAIFLYNQALNVRPHLTTAVKARILREIGVELVEIHELDLAEKYLKESLKYEPDNQGALGELQYIDQLEAKGAAGATDPVQLIANEHPTVCSFCGQELHLKPDSPIEALNVEDRVLYLCADCAKLPDIKVQLLLQVLNQQFENQGEQGEWAEALEVAQRILAIVEQNFAANQPELGRALTALALAYKKLGRYAAAEPLYQQALAVYEEARGPEHPDVATALHNLAELYRLQGNYAEVEPLHQRALEIKLQAYGPEHPAFTQAAHDLAELYSAQGRFAEAEPLLQMALEIKERALGPEHPDLISTLNGLAVLNHRQGRLAEAEKLYERLIKVFIKALGSDHPQFAQILSNLAGLYTDQGKYDEAEMLYQHALEIFETTLGPEHPNVQMILNMLLDLCKRQERYAEAAQYYNRLLGFSL